VQVHARAGAGRGAAVRGFDREAGGGMGSGSGLLGLVPLDRGEQGGSNGTSWSLVVAVLTEIRGFEIRVRFF
jgi:hypothetical protein